MKKLLPVFFVTLSLIGGGTAGAVSINTTDRGYYSTGGLASTNNSYFAGDFSSTVYNNFFAFNLSGVTGTVTSAVLHLFNPSGGFVSSGSSETYRVNNFTGNVNTLMAGTGGTTAFNDLGGGTAYGSYTASAADNGKYIDITLNAAALADINARLGSLIAFGGNITTLGGAGTEGLFWGSSTSPLNGAQLILTTALPTPEPGTWVLMGTGLVGLVGYGWRRKQQQNAEV